MPPIDLTLLLTLAGTAVLGLYAVRLVRRRGMTGMPEHTLALQPWASATKPQSTVADGAKLRRATDEPASRGPLSDLVTPSGPAQRISAALHEWLADCHDQPDLWVAFDQLVRELLTEHAGATRVRCYHVHPGCETLQTIAQAGQVGQPRGPSIRAGVLGHVATTGQEYVAGGITHGPLVEHLATASEERWSWIWPVCSPANSDPAVRRQLPLSGEPSAPAPRAAVVGIVAVAGTPGAEFLPPADRRLIGQLLSLCWLHVSCLVRLRILSRTDQASGVLTRHDFFELATHALSESYRDGEPVVVAVLVLEGLRRLDDTGLWQQRDALIERIGPIIARRVRSDDLVGRFADDRFVVLLRRLDTGLGRLIAEKLLAAGDQVLEELKHVRAHVRLRVGLAGSGLCQPPLEQLLVTAFSTVEQARRDDVPVATDLPAG